jgi:hypothetical protein
VGSRAAAAAVSLATGADATPQKPAACSLLVTLLCVNHSVVPDAMVLVGDPVFIFQTSCHS